MEKKYLLSRLIDEFQYSPKGATLIVEKILACASDLREAFFIWWESGELPLIEVEGYTVERLMREQCMNPIAALLTLDYLRREPQKALVALRKGHDQIFRK